MLVQLPVQVVLASSGSGPEAAGPLQGALDVPPVPRQRLGFLLRSRPGCCAAQPLRGVDQACGGAAAVKSRLQLPCALGYQLYGRSRRMKPHHTLHVLLASQSLLVQTHWQQQGNRWRWREGMATPSNHLHEDPAPAVMERQGMHKHRQLPELCPRNMKRGCPPRAWRASSCRCCRSCRSSIILEAVPASISFSSRWWLTAVWCMARSSA